MASLLWLPRWAQQADPKAMASSPAGPASLFLPLHHPRARECHAQRLAHAAGLVPRTHVDGVGGCEPVPARYARCVQRRLQRGCPQPVLTLTLVLAKVQRQEEM